MKFRSTEPVALAFGSICGGNADNVIPDKVSVSGTIGATRPEDNELSRRSVEADSNKHDRAYRNRAEIRSSGGVSAVTNDPACSNVARRAIQSLGLEKDCTSFNTVMASENFADFLKVYPGVFAFIGVRNAEIDAVYPHHHAKFKSMKMFFSGRSLYAQYSIEYFRSENKEKHNG